MRPASNKVEKNVLHRESPGPHTGARRAILFVSTRNALRHRRVLGNGIRCGQHGVLISSRLVGRVRTDQDPASVERVCRVFGPRCGVRNDHFDGLRAVILTNLKFMRPPALGSCRGVSRATTSTDIAVALYRHGPGSRRCVSELE